MTIDWDSVCDFAGAEDWSYAFGERPDVADVLRDLPGAPWSYLDSRALGAAGALVENPVTPGRRRAIGYGRRSERLDPLPLPGATGSGSEPLPIDKWFVSCPKCGVIDSPDAGQNLPPGWVRVGDLKGPHEVRCGPCSRRTP
jgi:hypothetical protein